MRRSVTKALQHWQAQGLLTGQQVATLAASLEHVERPEESARAVRVFAVIGAVLTGLGAILFVASHWDGISPLQRTLALLAGYGLTVVAAVVSERRELPLVGEALWLLSTLVLGANIFLIAQSYNLALTLWQGTLAWMIGALAMGYARQSAPQAAVAVPLAILTIGWAGGGTGWFFDDQVEFFFADAGLRPLLPLLGLAFVALSSLVALRDRLSFARRPCFRWGVFIVAATLILTTAHVELASAFFDADFSPRQVLLVAGAAALVLAAVVAGKLESPASRPAMAGLLGLSLAVLIPAGERPWIGLEVGGLHLPFGLYVAAIFAMSLFVIWLGMNSRDPQLVNLGMVSTTLIVIIQYFGWSFELLDRSMAFILGGVVLIALSLYAERKRRQILVRMTA